MSDILTQIRTADTLAQSIERSVSSFNPLVQKRIVKKIKLKGVTHKDLNTVFMETVFDLAGNEAANMGSYLRAVTGQSAVRFAPADIDSVLARGNTLLHRFYNVKNISVLLEGGDALVDYITGQTDRTLDRESLKKPRYNYRRHVNDGACQYCIDQISAYAETRRWFRHANCKCFKVREV